MIYHRDNTAHATGAIYSHAHCDFGRLSTQATGIEKENTKHAHHTKRISAACRGHLAPSVLLD